MTLREKKLFSISLAVSALVIFNGCASSIVKSPNTQNRIASAVITQNNKSSAASDKPQISPPPETTSADDPSTEPVVDTAATAEILKADRGKPGVPDAGIGDAKLDAGIAADALSFEKKVQLRLDEALDLCEVSQEFWQKGELDNALDTLDQAYALILEVNISDQPKLIQQKEDLRYLISRRILEIYASRNIVVNGNHNAIPVVINKYVQAEIDHFTRGGERNFFIESYKRSGRYRPQIVAELRKAGLPTELSWLPLIESGFKVRALSKARALGLWQFIPSTGYKFGLSRDKYIDERLDPDKATQAAIAYMKELHQIFGDWTTVLAAYNCGEGRVLRVIREQNVNYLDNFWDLYERLPYETARYVPRFLATLHILENPERYGLDNVAVDQPHTYEKVTVSKQIHLRNAARAISATEQYLVDLNPELRYKILPPTQYALNVPTGTGQILLTGIDQIPVTSPPTRAFVYHRVRRGESLSIIARKYRTSVRRIMRANNLRSSHYIVAGRLLKIPQRGYKYGPKKSKKRYTKYKTTHTVSRGDSLWNIANKYGVTTKKIQELNNLPTTKLYIGQILRLREQPKAASVVKGYKVYEVKPGDNPFTIAQQHNMALSRFMRINQLSNRSRIYPGQQLYIE